MEAVRVELRADNQPQARSILAKALQECPSSGLLWSEAIFIEPRPARKSKSVDAIKRCEGDGRVVAAVARLFWSERNLDKARSWFERAVKLQPDIGDIWATYLKFELQHGTAEAQQRVEERCVSAEPHHGQVWCRVAKHPQHWRTSIRDVLRAVAEEVPGAV